MKLLVTSMLTLMFAHEAFSQVHIGVRVGESHREERRPVIVERRHPTPPIVVERRRPAPPVYRERYPAPGPVYRERYPAPPVYRTNRPYRVAPPIIVYRNYGPIYRYDNVQRQIQSLGGTFLGNSEDADTIDVFSCSGGHNDKRVYALQFMANNDAVRLDYAWVYFYGQQQPQYIELSTGLSQGEYSGFYDLEGGARCITQIQLVGESTGYNRDYYGNAYDTQQESYVQIFGDVI